MTHALALLALLAATGPAKRPDGLPPSGAATAHAAQAGPAARARIVAAARRHLHRPFRGDCSGFVRRVYRDAKVRVPPSTGRTGTEALHRALRRVARPRPGDLAFFHRTYDRDRPGPGRNLFTHVGVVERVRGSRVVLIHRGNAGVERLRLDLARPRDPSENDALRRRRPGDRPGQRYLAGELLAGFAAAPGEAALARPAPPRSPGAGASPRRPQAARRGAEVAGTSRRPEPEDHRLRQAIR